jgi:hypothetical protein
MNRPISKGVPAFAVLDFLIHVDGVGTTAFRTTGPRLRSFVVHLCKSRFYNRKLG